MVAYHYVVIHQRGTAIELQITDSSTINPLLDKLSASIAGFGASASKLPGGDPYYWRLYGLGQDMDEAWAMIVEHFGSQGWTALDSQPADGPEADLNLSDRSICFGLIQNKPCVEAA